MSEDMLTSTDEGAITRRELFANIAKAAAGAGALAALGTGAALAGCSSQSDTQQVDVLEVAEDDVVTLDSFTEVKKPKKSYKVSNVAKLGAGAIISSSNSKLGAALCVGKTANPLSTVSLVDLESGKTNEVLAQAVGQDEDFSIFDVTCSSKLLLWVESNYLTGDWRVYSARIKTQSKTEEKIIYLDTEIDYEALSEMSTQADSDGDGIGDGEAITSEEAALDYLESLYDNVLYDDNDRPYRVETTTTRSFAVGEPQKLDEGDASYDEPEIAVVGDQAYWIVQPADGSERSEEDSLLKNAGGSAVAVAYTSHGRFNGGLSVSGKTLTVMPRAETTSGVYYQLTALQGSAVVATQVLPRSYRPGSAIYMDNAFAFSIPASYDYGGGIANVGTYYPMPNGQWLRLTRQPVTPPGICNGWLYCKSGSRTVFVDMTGQRYFTVDPPGDSASYGDYSCSFGQVDAVCNYASVEKVDGKDRTKYVQLRRIEPVSIT